jgi:hypothetical protein
MTNLPQAMRGVWLTGHGDLDKLEIRHDIPVPDQDLTMFWYVWLLQVSIIRISIPELPGIQKK